MPVCFPRVQRAYGPHGCRGGTRGIVYEDDRIRRPGVRPFRSLGPSDKIIILCARAYVCVCMLYWRRRRTWSTLGTLYLDSSWWTRQEWIREATRLFGGTRPTSSFVPTLSYTRSMPTTIVVAYRRRLAARLSDTTTPRERDPGRGAWSYVAVRRFCRSMGPRSWDGDVSREASISSMTARSHYFVLVNIGFSFDRLFFLFYSSAKSSRFRKINWFTKQFE